MQSYLGVRKLASSTKESLWRSWHSCIDYLSQHIDVNYESKWFNSLMETYTQPWRAFHNEQWLHSVLTKANYVAANDNISEIVRNLLIFSAFFSYSSYNPRTSYWDLDGSKQAENAALDFYLFDSDSMQIADAVSCFYENYVVQDYSTFLSGALRDITFSWQGETSYRYDLRKYRGEFAALGVEDRFVEVRRNELIRFLGKDHIYYTNAYRQLKEANARKVLIPELEELEKIYNESSVSS